MFELRLQREGGTVYVHRVGVVPVQIGRAPNNDLVLADPMVSQQHAVVFVRDAKLMVRDLGSRNGTFVGEDRVAGTAEIPDGVQLKIGPDTAMRATKIEGDNPAVPLGFVVEDVGTGLCTGMATDRVYIGSGANADLAITDGPEELAAVIIHDNGEIWVGTEDDEFPVEAGTPFEVQGRTFLIRPGDALRAPTQQPKADRYPYAVSSTLSGATGPEATVKNVATGHLYKVEAENRAILLYLLARQVVRDREQGMSAGDVGWCTDDDVRIGVWGRGAGEDNKLHVLVYRLRNELKKAGFDPWFIEKRRKYIRVRVVGAEVE